MSLYSHFRVSRPSAEHVPPERQDAVYRRLRSRTFRGVTVAYSLYYICRMTLSVVKQPVIDGGVLTVQQLGVIGSVFYFVYAFGKFFNGFIADYCNIRRFMAAGLAVSVVINLAMGAAGLAGLPSLTLFLLFAVLWGVNGWAQSMGSPPGVISLSRWFPRSSRGTAYSLFMATPYVGEALAVLIIERVIHFSGWEGGFLVSALCGALGVAVIFAIVSDTPESKGLPSIQALTGETPVPADQRPTAELQRAVLRHPGIWVIALSCAFIYIARSAVSDWGILFLQKAKAFSLADATQVIAFSTAFGIAGTVVAGWLSDRVFRGNRVQPVCLAGALGLAALGFFLFTGGSYVLNILYVSVFSLSIGIVYCIVGGLMALDIVPRKATGAAVGIVGISSYAASGLQSLTSGFLIRDSLDFTAAGLFWMGACLLCIVLPVLGWHRLVAKN